MTELIEIAACYGVGTILGVIVFFAPVLFNYHGDQPRGFPPIKYKYF